MLSRKLGDHLSVVNDPGVKADSATHAHKIVTCCPLTRAVVSAILPFVFQWTLPPV